MIFKNFVVELRSFCASVLAVFPLYGIFILITSTSTIIRGAEIEGTNPLSRRLLLHNKSNSSSSSLPHHSSSNSESKEILIMQNITEKINNFTTEISHSKHFLPSGGKKGPKSLSKGRVGKRRRFRIKQSSFPPQKSRRESRPYFHDFSPQKKKNNDGIKKRKSKNMLKKKEQLLPELNFDKGFHEAESLKMKILSQLGSTDPLLCLPKALCGLASNYEEKSRIQKTLHTKTTTEISNNGMPSNIKDQDDEDWVNNYMELMKTFVPKNDDGTKQKKSKIRDNDLGDSSSSEESVEGDKLSDDIFSPEEEELSQDDLNYFKKKARIEKWIKDDAFDPEPNWWDILPQNQPYHPLDEPAPHGESSGGSGGSWSTLRISKGLSSFFTSMLPQVSWGFGKAPDVFADDPWFQDYRKRSFSGRSIGSDDQKRSFSWLFGKTNAVGERTGERTPEWLHSQSGSKDGQRTTKGRNNKNNKVNNKKNKKNKNRNRLHRLNDDMMIDDDNPMEKFQLAVEIGKQMEDPKQCDYVFTGCPFSYLEIIEIIESSKKSAVEDGVHKGNQFDLGSLGLINNSTSTISHDLPTGGKLEISLKIADKDLGTMIPLSAILQQNSPEFAHPTSLTMTATPSDADSKLPPIYLPPPPTENDVQHQYNHPDHSHHTITPSSPTPLFRTALFDKTENQGGNEDDSLESSMKPPTNPTPVRIRPQSKPKDRRRNKVKEGQPSKAPKTRRKQWGSQQLHHHHRHQGTTHISPVVVQLQPPQPLLPPPSPPTIHRQPQFHTTHTKYKHIPMPTTINKPSHVINYHFHNTNTHPQVQSSHTQRHPSQLTVHSYPQTLTTAPPPVSTSTTPEPIVTSTSTTTTRSPPPIRFRDEFEPPKRHRNKQRRRRRYKSPTKRVEKVSISRRRKPKPSRRSSSSEEERIVIRLPETSPQPPNNNNYYNLYPLLNSLYNNPTPQPQGHHQMYQPQQPHYHSSLLPSIQPQTQPYFISQSNHPQGFQPHPHHPSNHHHQSHHPYYPHTPLLTPGIFSYSLGKKK